MTLASSTDSVSTYGLTANCIQKVQTQGGKTWSTIYAVKRFHERTRYTGSGNGTIWARALSALRRQTA